MYSYTPATLSIRAKCSLSYNYLFIPNDQPHCCHRPWYYYSANGFFPLNPRFVSGFLLDQSFTAPSRALVCGHWRSNRVLSRSHDSELMRLLAEPEERFLGLEELGWKSGSKEVGIKSVERRGSRKDRKAGSSLWRSDGSCSVGSLPSNLLRELELNETGRRRAGGESIVGYDNSRRGTKFNVVDMTEAEAREVHKYVDNSCRWRRCYSERDVVVDSTKCGSMKENDCSRQSGVKAEHENVDLRASLAQAVNSTENGSHRKSQRVTRISAVQPDYIKRTSVYSSVKKNEKREGLASSSARKSSDMDHQEVRHNESRTIQEKLNKVADVHGTNVQNAAYTQRSFQKTTVRDREEQRNLGQNSTQVERDKIIYFDRQALEQDKSTRHPQRLSQVSTFNASSNENTSGVGDKRLLGMNMRTNLVPDSCQQFGMALQRPIEGKSEEREEKLAMEGNSIQLRRAAGKQIDRSVPKHDEAIRRTEILGQSSKVSSSNLEDFSLFEGRRITGMESKSNFVQSSVPSAKDRGIQVEMNEANEATDDLIEMSMFDVNTILNSRSSRSPSDSRDNRHEYTTLLDLNQVSSTREKYCHANKQAHIEYSADIESEKDTAEFDATRSKNGRISSIRGSYNSRIETKKVSSSSKTFQYSADVESERVTKEFDVTRSNDGSISTLHENHSSRIENRNDASSPKTSVSLIQDKEMQKISLNGESPKSSTRQVTSTGNSHAGGCDIDQIGGLTNDSATESDKSSASHVAEFVGNLQKEIVALSELGKTPNVSSGIQIGEPSRRNVQATSAMQVDEHGERRRYDDGRYINEGGRLSSSELGLKGPSDEMWDVQGVSSQKTSNAVEPEVDFPTFRATDLTTSTPTTVTTIIRRPHKSLWSYVTDIIRMSWILRDHSHSSVLESDKRTSSNESLGSETWFSGHEPDEVASGDETQIEEKISLLKESIAVKESVEPLFGERKNGDRLAMIEPKSSITSGLLKKSLSTKTSSSPIETEHAEDAKVSHRNHSSAYIVEQQLALEADAALSSTTDIIESGITDKVKVLKPSSSYPVSIKKIGFSSSIAHATDVEQLISAQVWEGNNSGLETFEQPSVSTVDPALSKITKIEEVDMSGNVMQRLGLVPFMEKLPEIGGTKESEIKQRKFRRNKQVLREQFDEWEEAFKLENEQRKLDEFFMKEAILEARKGADIWEVPVGAVLVQNGKIIARGCNMVEDLRDSTAHAEMICIREASNILRTWRLAETTLYVTLEPCPMCAGAILQARIDTVVWGAPNRLLGADGSWVRLFPGGGGESGSNMDSPSQMIGPVHPLHPKIKIRRGVLSTECSDVMQQFFKLRKKKKKEPASPSCLPISNRPTKFFTKLHNIFCMMFCL